MMMRKLCLEFFCLVLFATGALAQFTTVTGTVTDPNGLPYAYGTIVPVLVTNGVSPTLNGLPYSPPTQPAGLDKTGSFTINLAASASIGGLQWNFWVCSATGSVQPSLGKGSQCFTLASPLTISGSTQSITTQLTAAALALSNITSSGSSFPVSSPQTVNTGGSIAPAGVGQNVSNQALSTDFNMVSLGLTANASGGGLLPNHTIEVQYTLVNGTGESLPSALTTIGTSASCPGNVCSVVVTAPTIPAGFNYNLYVCDNSSGGQACTGGPQKDTWDSPSGVNVPSGTNFTIKTWPNSATTSVPTVATAFYQPSPTENNVCAQQVNPIMDWMQDASGNWWTYGGTNPSNGNGRTVPTRYFCMPVVWDDTQENNSSFNNSLVDIVHTAGTYTSTANQDHALGVVVANATGDSTNHYGIEAIQAQGNFNGTGGISGSPDGEFAIFSGQLEYNNTTPGVSCGSYGCNVIRAVNFRESGAAYPASAGWGAILAEFQNNSTVAAGSTMAPVIRAKCLDTSTANALFCADFYADAPSTTFAQGYDAYLNDTGSGSLFFNIRSTAANENQGKVILSGATFLEHISPANLVAALAFTPPTCNFATGGGTTPGCTVRAGSADSLGRIVLTTGTGSPAGTGTATITFHTSWGSPNTDSDCSFQARNDGGTWQSIVGFVITASSTSALTVQWTNGTTPTALTASTTYDLIYTCKGA